jgi:hypothetical protein
MPLYRELKPGEKLRSGDEFRETDPVKWVPTMFAGQPVLPIDEGRYRRPLKPKPTTAMSSKSKPSKYGKPFNSLPATAIKHWEDKRLHVLGFRLLEIGEVIEKGDQSLLPSNARDKWGSATPGFIVSKDLGLAYRRRILGGTPKPEVKLRYRLVKFDRLLVFEVLEQTDKFRRKVGGGVLEYRTRNGWWVKSNASAQSDSGCETVWLGGSGTTEARAETFEDNKARDEAYLAIKAALKDWAENAPCFKPEGRAEPVVSVAPEDTFGVEEL